MLITVREALKFPSLRKAKLLGGHQGLDNQIKFVNVMEVLDVTKWLKGGELLITSGFHFMNAPEVRRRIIYDLAEKNVAAFGIKTGLYLQKVPEDIVEHANRSGLPLLELAPDTAYSEILVQVFEKLLSQQLCRIKRSEEIRNRLIEELLKGSGLSSICLTLAGLQHNPVLISDEAGNLLASAWPNAQLDQELQNEVLDCLKDPRMQMFALTPHRWHRVTLQLSDGEQDIILIPIIVSDDIIVGNLVIVERFGQLEELDLVAMEHASTVIALEFVKQKAVLDTECQIRGELLEDLIDGNYKCEEEIIRRAKHLQFDLNSDLRIFVIGIDYFDSYFDGHGKKDQKRILGIRTEILKLVRSSFFNYPDGIMILGKNDSIVGLVHQLKRKESDAIHGKLLEVVRNIKAKLPRVRFAIGLGGAYKGVSNVRKSYDEAVIAERIGRFMNGPASITYFDGLGPYRFLYELKDSAMVKKFVDEYVGKIIEYDQENNAELLDTMAAYFNNNCSLNRTADSLFIHKNTVIYRLKKIEEITGLNARNADDGFSLQFCLKFGQLVNKYSATEK